MDVRARCAHDFPECICTRCANNQVDTSGVRCCWTAKRMTHHIKTRCSVQECPNFKEETHDCK